MLGQHLIRHESAAGIHRAVRDDALTFAKQLRQHADDIERREIRGDQMRLTEREGAGERTAGGRTAAAALANRPSG